ncbi:O-glycoside alpha-1,2-mannosyltransferase omh1 [Schizosaccharomyces pombe]|uniref:O-glycoside alpha-1,2-mannosyltransferase omh1 n=1 Tax=Schizosaccharomyces pombe (strain 972 / ATCC 24843) TaxID=284812 RepID=OMH1_SCHPO|nr:alpha-1,2-mannosyltransferase Omh1 [Schizosaccharomyces pombe]O60160.1 RecName: Full=O-glycoside alpha-1,2-mannosyltransferase omh1 [Schizosaccharomyces pombe 972h-]CAA19580.1 alpha-1,2-mannosyltransferase Omh1 [Schizosaccharomyces pombe]|eukprot:NP_596168.1 alpha-1,2-mannosyltransferase Omh1 [Schizosaccharomyces pombe]
MVRLPRKFKRVLLLVVLLTLVVFVRFKKQYIPTISVFEGSLIDNRDTLSYFNISNLEPSERSEWLPNKRVNAAFVTLARNEDLNDLLKSIRKLEKTFNHKYHYGWVFLNNEEFSDEFKEHVIEAVSGKCEFGLVPQEQWSIPEYIDQDKMHENWKKLQELGILYADKESYRHMCRFESGFFYRHPLVQKYEYYWRVEPSVDFFCDLDFDPFAYMKENNKAYAFTITVTEYSETIPSLWPSTKEFIKMHPNALHPNNALNFISNDDGETYNGCHFWTNFEIAKVDFWESEVYSKYFDYLDKSGNFFYERWGDAPVHSIAVSLFADRDNIHFFNEIGYWHPGSGHCPLDDATRAKCDCDPYESIDYNGWSCLDKFYTAFEMPFPENWSFYSH